MKNFLNSFIYAARGIMLMVKEQRNIKIQMVVALFVVACGIYFNIALMEWCVIVIMIVLVIGFETMNSAIEDTVNLITKDYHPLAGKIKDIAAGAVMIVSAGSVIVGIIIFWKYVF